MKIDLKQQQALSFAFNYVQKDGKVGIIIIKLHCGGTNSSSSSSLLLMMVHGIHDVYFVWRLLRFFSC